MVPMLEADNRDAWLIWKGEIDARAKIQETSENGLHVAIGNLNATLNTIQSELAVVKTKVAMYACIGTILGSAITAVVLRGFS